MPPSCVTLSRSFRTTSPPQFSSAGRRSCAEVRSTGVPLAADVESAIASHAPDVVVDLSDEPVLGPPERLALASRVLACGVPYVGADFRFDPPTRAPFEMPSIAVVGTGKRVGKDGSDRASRATALGRPRRGRRRDGPRRAARARGDDDPADGRGAGRALALRATRRVGPPRDRSDRGRRNGRLPALRWRARRRGRDVERGRGCAHRCGSRSGPRGVRRQRCCVPTDRHRSHSRRRRRAPGSSRRNRIPQRLSATCRRPRGRHDGRARGRVGAHARAGRGDRSTGRADRRHDASPAPAGRLFATGRSRTSRRRRPTRWSASERISRARSAPGSSTSRAASRIAASSDRSSRRSRPRCISSS